MTVTKKVHVNQHKIRANKERPREDEEPVLAVKTYKDNVYCWDVVIHGETTVKYRPHSPMNCGAVAWVETEGRVDMLDRKGEVVGRVTRDGKVSMVAET